MITHVSQGMEWSKIGKLTDANGFSFELGENEYESLPSNFNSKVHMMAGAMAGIMEHGLMYPIDSVKVS